MLLALPQLPLTLGNAVIAITDENNRLFPERPVNENRLSTSTGLLNLARRQRRRRAHVPWRRRHGGTRRVRRAHGRRTRHPRRVVLLAAAIFFQRLGRTLFSYVPPSHFSASSCSSRVLSSRSAACDISKDKGERFVTVVTAALAVWNVGIAFVVGVTAYWLNKKGLLRV